MHRKKPDSARGLHLIRLICFLAAFHPNCTRCCPTGTGSCDTYWAWENCPPQQGCGGCGGSGCNSCNSCQSAATGLTVEPPGFEAGPAPHSQQLPPATTAASAADPGGTLAFVATDTGTFAVVAIGATDHVRIVRVDVNALDEDPLTVRTVGDLVMQPGDEPGRVVSDAHGHALVALRSGGAIAEIDPVASAVVDRRRTCDAPRDVAVDAVHDTAYVACASGALASLRLSDGAETRRVWTGAALRGVRLEGNAVAADDGVHVFVVDADGEVASREAVPALGPFATAALSDTATLDAMTALVDDGDAYLRTSPQGDFAPVGGPGLTRAVALADVTNGDGVVRRVLGMQTVSPRMLVLFTVTDSSNVAALEALE